MVSTQPYRSSSFWGPCSLRWQRKGSQDYHAALDAAGNVYLLGQYQGKLSLAPGRPELSCAGKGAFVAKVSPRGEPLWLRSLSGRACALAVSPGGEVHLAGWFGGSLAVGAEKLLTCPGGQSAFVCKLSRDGRPAWAHALGEGGKNA